MNCEFDSNGKCKRCGHQLPDHIRGKVYRICCEDRSIGLGDTIAKGLEKLGVRKKAGCRCAERKEKLNEIFPYKKADD